MVKKSKIIIIIFIIVVVVLGGYFIVRNVSSHKEDKVQTNTNENVIKDQEVGGFHFSNTALIYEDGKSKLTTSIKNITENDAMLQSFDIIVHDKNGEEITTLLGYVGNTIKPGETIAISSEVNMNLMDAYSIQYVVHN